jgi:succinate dehydrogenase hydrophobic anchor subunit
VAQIVNGSAPRKGETAWLWFIKMVTGPILVVVVFIHMVVNHLVATDGLLTYQDVVNYFRNPWVVGMEIVLLTTVVSHSLLGVRGIILDLNPSRAVLKVIDWVFGLVGIGAVVYGVWLALTIAAH